MNATAHGVGSAMGSDGCPVESMDVRKRVVRGIYKSGRWDSNPRRSAWEADILPLNYARVMRSLKAAEWSPTCTVQTNPAFIHSCRTGGTPYPCRRAAEILADRRAE